MIPASDVTLAGRLLAPPKNSRQLPPAEPSNYLPDINKCPLDLEKGFSFFTGRKGDAAPPVSDLK